MIGCIIATIQAKEDEMAGKIIAIANYSQTNILKFIFILCFFLNLGKSAQISPFSSALFAPSEMSRISHSATLSTAPSSTFAILFPTPFTATPLILPAITALTFHGGLTFDLSIANPSNTGLQCVLTYESVLTKLSFSVLAFDSLLYTVTLTYFTYTAPASVSGTQKITVTNMENHMAAFMTGIDLKLGALPGGFIPQVFSEVVSQGDIVRTNLTISYNTDQLTIHKYKAYFVDFDVGTFTAVPYYKSGQKWTVYGTGGIATDPYQTPGYLSQYPKNYLTGLTTIYSAQFLAPSALSLDIAQATTSKTYYFTSEFLLVSYFCPTKFPYTDATRQFCYSSCGVSEYYDSQFMCQPCGGNCLGCSFSPTNCTSCVLPYVLRYGYVCGCPEDSYEYVAANGSVACGLCSTSISGCFACSSSSVCTKCMNNLVLAAGGSGCSCAGVGILTQIGVGSYCVTTAANGDSYAAETCLSGYKQEQLSCQCTSRFGLVLNKGVCQ